MLVPVLASVLFFCFYLKDEGVVLIQYVNCAHSCDLIVSFILTVFLIDQQS
jgi:hypothetical protein